MSLVREAPRTQPRVTLEPVEVAETRDGLSNKLTIISALRIALVTASLGASFFVRRVPDEPFENREFGLIAVAYAISLGYTLLLKIGVAPRLLAFAQLFADATLVSLLVAATGGIESVFTFAYVFVVISGAFTLFRLGAALGTVLSLVLLTVIALVQVDGGAWLLNAVVPSRAALSVFTYTMSLSLVAALASTLAETARATGEKLAERESDLERLEVLHATILRSLPAGLMTVDRDGVVMFANDAARALLGLDESELLGRTLADVVPPMGRALAVVLSQAHVPSARDRAEASYVRPGGGAMRLGYSFAPLGVDGSAAVSGLPMPASAQSQALGHLVVFQDLTEIVRLKEAFERAERLATVGKLAAGLAHEVRNPLASMCASVDVLRSTLDPPDAMKRLMDNVIREGERLNNLITDFLNFARPREVLARPTELSDLVARVLEMVQQDPRFARVHLVKQLEPDLVVRVDPDQVRQVLWNIVRNGSQAALDGGGELRVTTRRGPHAVEVVVADDGPGISPEVLKRIFDPFFTTKADGTGLGLAIAHSIVEAHRGSILVSSTLGEGTELVLRFPSDDAPTLTTLPPQSAADLIVTHSVDPGPPSWSAT